MDWQQLALTLLCAGVGGFIGVKVAVTRLQTQMEGVLKEIESLRKAKHEHANTLGIHEQRIGELERWRDNG